MSTRDRTTDRAVRLLLLGCLLAGPAACRAAGDAPVRVDLGAFGSADRDPQGARRTRVLGPLLEWREDADGRRFFALRPFYSRVREPAADRARTDILWPLGVVKRLGTDVFWRAILAYGNDFDRTDPGSRKRNVIFPFVFWGRDRQGAPYFAVFPLFGKVHEYLGLDTIRFILWPIYVRSTLTDITTHTILWPLISWGEGMDVRRFRVAPFYGKSFRATKWDRRFILWPFWTSVKFGEKLGDGYGFILFPFFSRIERREESTWMVIPPLFRWSSSPKHSVRHLPWPFVQLVDGDRQKRYFWPLWGWKQLGGRKSWFTFWPLFWGRRVERANYVVHQQHAVPFVFSERRVPKGPAAAAGTGVPGAFFRFWPLVSYRREGTATRLRFVDLWPSRRAKVVERNFAPYWTLFQRVRDGDTVDTELLWGLFRRRRWGAGGRYMSLFPLFSTFHSDGAEETRWSILAGLLGRRREGLRSTWRLLYFFQFQSAERVSCTHPGEGDGGSSPVPTPAGAPEP